MQNVQDIMSDPIADILSDFFNDPMGMGSENTAKLIRQIVEDELRQQIGRELLDGESWAVPRHKVVEVCKLNSHSESTMEEDNETNS